jgi:hypothetical protein
MDLEEYNAKVEEIWNRDKRELKKYDIKITKILSRRQKDLIKLASKFAESNNNVKVGDIVKDHMGSICVERIDLYRSKVPCLIYYGTCCTKKGVPYKRIRKRGVYQTNLIKENM